MSKIIAVIFALVMPMHSFAQAKNEIPLYGNLAKTESEKKADRDFIELSVAAAGSKEKASDRILDRGWQYISEGDPITAIKRFNQAYLLTPERSQVYWGLGVASSMRQDFKAAQDLFDRAIKMDPNNSRLMSDAGRSLLQEALAVGRENKGITPAVTKLFDKAEQVLLKAKKTDPKSSLPWAHLAALYLYRNQIKEASEAVNQAQSLGGDGLDPRLVQDIASAQRASIAK